jgi:hypothetical protein
MALRRLAGMFVVTGSGSVLEESYVVWPRGWGGILLEFAAMLDGISYPYAHLLYILFYFLFLLLYYIKYIYIYNLYIW